MNRQNLLLAVPYLICASLLGPLCSAAETHLVIEVHSQIRNSGLPEEERHKVQLNDDRPANLVAAVLEEAGLEYKFHFSPWTRIFQLLDSQPNVLAYPVARTEEREQHIYWAGKIRKFDLALYGLTMNAHQLPTTLEQARDFRIGVLRGDVIDNYLSNLGFTNLVHFNSLENSLGMLQRGRFDLFPFDPTGVGNILSQNELPAGFLTPMVALEDISSELYIALSQQSNPKVKQQIRDAYLEIVRNGTYEEIMGTSYAN